MKALLLSPSTGSSELVAAPAAEPIALVTSASALCNAFDNVLALEVAK